MLRNLMVIEELHLLTSSAAERVDIGQQVVSALAREGRKFGCGLLVVDQIPSLVPVPIIGNMNTVVTLRLLSGKDLRTVGDTLALSPDEQEFLTQLPPQVGVVRIRRYPKAFVLRVPDVAQGEISEAEIAAATEKALAALGWRERSRAVAADVADAEEPDETSAAEQNTGEEQPEPASKLLLKKDALDYLCEIAARPWEETSQRYARLGLSGSKGTRLTKLLIDRQLISQERVSTGKGRITLLEVSPEGRELLAQLGVKPPDGGRGRGGAEHVFWQHTVKAWLERRGWAASVEDATLGKAIDVLAVKDGRKAAYEITCQNKHEDEVNNVVKDLKLVDAMVVCCKTKEQLERLRSMVAEAELFAAARVQWRLLSDFLD